MRVPNLSKALGRARQLSLGGLAAVAARRTQAALRARAEERAAHKLGLQTDDPELLPRVVPGSTSLADALARLEATAGALPPTFERDLLRTPVREELIARADRSCAGLWKVLGFPEANLGRMPDWHGDFVHGGHWDATVPARKQPIVRGDGSDIKVPWELSRLQHLPPVAEAFALTQEARYRDLVCLHLRDWISRNPPGLGVNWTCAMEVALRAVNLSWAFERVRRDPTVGADLRARVYWSLFAHGHHILGHLEDSGAVLTNHYVADLLGLIWLGTLYPAFSDAQRWREEGLSKLLAHLPDQVRPDGGDEESSLAYHRLVLEMLGLAFEILATNGHGAPFLRDTLMRMARFTAAMLKPDGTAPQIGDNDGGRVLNLLDRPPLDHRYLLSWTRRVCGDDALIGKPEDGQLFQFAPSGLTRVQLGETYVLLAATPVGQHGAGGHGHNDKLSLELFRGGDLITDSGTYAYTSNVAARNAFRSTSAHATMQLDDLEQNPLPEADPFHMPERAQAKVLRCELRGSSLVWEAEHRGFGRFVHRRRVTASATRLVIVDSVFGESAQSHDLAIRFPLAPGLAPTIAGNRVEVRRGAERVLVFDTAEAAWGLEAGAYSPNYGVRVDRAVLVAHLRTKLPASVTLELTLGQQARGDPDTPAPRSRS